MVSLSFGSNGIQDASIRAAEPVAALRVLLLLDVDSAFGVGNGVTILVEQTIGTLSLSALVSLSNKTAFVPDGLNLRAANCSFKCLTCIFDKSSNDIDNGRLTSAASASSAAIGSVSIGAGLSYSLSDRFSLK